ncbi:MAG: RDD family protein [Sutterellaceae bacterium]|nr:RDD family protein [Sutterellaceae bacterium]
MANAPYDPLFKRRTIARGIDSLLVFLCGFPMGTVVYVASYNYLEPLGKIASDQGASVIWIVCTVAVIGIIHMTYESLFLFFFSATPGKLLMKLRVVDKETGGRLSFLQIYQRSRLTLSNALYYYFLYPFLLPFAWLWSKKRPFQPWDAKAETKVIGLESKAAPESIAKEMINASSKQS